MDGKCSTIPIRDAVIQAKRNLSSLIHWHFVFVLAPHLGESTNALMNPLVAINLFTASRRSHGILSNDGIDGLLKNVSNWNYICITPTSWQVENRIQIWKLIFTYLRLVAIISRRAITSTWSVQWQLSDEL